MQDRTPSTPLVPDFTPVPRRARVDGWTAERQRAFIDALADTGSVKWAAKRINMSPEGAYYLRRQPGAESFRAAWDAALDHGVQCLTDLAIDRAKDGVAVPIMYKGKVVAEKRRYNDRLLMWILRHHKPDRYGGAPGTSGGRDGVPPHVRDRMKRRWALEQELEQLRRHALSEMLRKFATMRERLTGADCEEGPSAADQALAEENARIAAIERELAGM